MSKEIQEFIEKIKNWKKEFSIEEYDYTKYNCEVADIMKMQKQNNIEGLIDFWRGKLKKHYFKLKHPIHNEITTWAVYNVYDGEVSNYIFMIDENNQYPWILFQNSHLINFCITPQKIYKIFSFWGFNMKPKILETSPSNWKFKKRTYGFTLQSCAPQHYFLDTFTSVLFLQDAKLKKVFPKESFFIPKIYQKSNLATDNLVYIYPATLRSSDEEKFCIDYVYKEALECFNEIIDTDKDLSYNLTLYLGLPSADYRAWIESIEGSVLILENLIPYFPKIKVYVDGMTAYDRERQDFPESKILYNKVLRVAKQSLNNILIFDTEEINLNKKMSFIKKVQSLIIFKSLAGLDYRTKICYGSMCDIAISEGNTTALVPFTFCKIPGVNFIPFTSWSKRIGTKIIDFKIDSNIIETFSSKNKPEGYKSYHIPSEYTYNLSAEVLEELKNIKMHRLEVPPVELYAKKYELEQKTQIKFGTGKNTKLLLKSIENQKMLLELDNLFLDKELKTLQIKKLQDGYTKLVVRDDLPSAKTRIHNHLAYKLGSAMIDNSKSFLGYIRMIYVLSYIKDKHLQEQKLYKEKIKIYPNLTLPPLESYSDYKEALKEKECFTYKLGLSFMKAHKTWYGGGYLRFFFKELPRLKKEFKRKKIKHH